MGEEEKEDIDIEQLNTDIEDIVEEEEDLRDMIKTIISLIGR